MQRNKKPQEKGINRHGNKTIYDVWRICADITEEMLKEVQPLYIGVDDNKGIIVKEGNNGKIY